MKLGVVSTESLVPSFDSMCLVNHPVPSCPFKPIPPPKPIMSTLLFTPVPVVSQQPLVVPGCGKVKKSWSVDSFIHAMKKSDWKTRPLRIPLLLIPVTDSQHGAAPLFGSMWQKVPLIQTQPPPGGPVPALPVPQNPPTTTPALLIPN